MISLDQLTFAQNSQWTLERRPKPTGAGNFKLASTAGLLAANENYRRFTMSSTSSITTLAPGGFGGLVPKSSTIESTAAAQLFNSSAYMTKGNFIILTLVLTLVSMVSTNNSVKESLDVPADELPSLVSPFAMLHLTCFHDTVIADGYLNFFVRVLPGY